VITDITKSSNSCFDNIGSFGNSPEPALSLYSNGNCRLVAGLPGRVKRMLASRSQVKLTSRNIRCFHVLPDSVFVEAGGLTSYGVDPRDLYRRAAAYVDKILKDESDRAIHRPTKFGFVIER
jgi:hypothetical protein